MYTNLIFKKAFYLNNDCVEILNEELWKLLNLALNYKLKYN